MRTKAATTMQFGVCTNNKGYPASLEVGKLYPVIPDGEAAKHGYLRVIDESGEDYGYSADRFLMLQVSESQAKVLRERLGPRVRRHDKAPQPTAAPRRRVNA